MRSRIAGADRLVESAAQDVLADRDHRANRHLSRIAGAPRLVERGPHQCVVVHVAAPTGRTCTMS
jgi:hypothetical protein